MPESTPAPNPPKPPTSENQPPGPEKPGRTRGTANRAHLNEITDSKKTVRSARDPRYAPGLAEAEMDPTLPVQIDALAKQTTRDIGTLRTLRTGGKKLTQAEAGGKDAILAALAPIQTAAKRKYDGDEATQRENYYIGEALATEAFDLVLLAGASVRDRLSPGDAGEPPQDTLPGIRPDKQIKLLADAVAQFDGSDAAQTGQQNDASALLEKIALAITALARLRRQIQLAADQAWPWRTQAVKAIRKAFLLPPDRPLTE